MFTKVSHALAAACTVVVVLAAGCASQEPVTTPAEPGGAPSRTAPSSAPSRTAPSGASPASPGPERPTSPDVPVDVVTVDLAVTVDDGAGTVTTRTLTCWPAAGDVPDPEAACAAVSAAGAGAFARPQKDVSCTAEFGGPATATASGTVGGLPVSASFDRTDGCGIDRWDSLAPLLGAVGSGS